MGVSCDWPLIPPPPPLLPSRSRLQAASPAYVAVSQYDTFQRRGSRCTPQQQRCVRPRAGGAAARAMRIVLL